MVCAAMIETDRLTPGDRPKSRSDGDRQHNPRGFGLAPDNFIDDMHVSAESLGLIK